MNNLFFNPALQNAPSRITSAKADARLFLDKNELSDDVDIYSKKKVLNGLLHSDWNRYPSADNKDIETRIASYCGLDGDQVVLGPGSASFITTLLNYFALNGKKIVIAQPTYTLFDYHCKTYNIPYQPWFLTADLEYDYENLPELGEGSVLIITTPNNPVGNTIERQKLEEILSANPDSFIIVDAVYAEFADEDFTSLVSKYDNLIVLRSFSKAFPIAGLRLGYVCTASQTAAMIRKLMLMFSINHFSLVFAREVLFSPEFIASSRQRVNTIREERKWMQQTLSSGFFRRRLKVFRSEGNFLLIRIFDQTAYQKVMDDLEKNGIKVLNTSPFPLLENTFRVSLGKDDENDFFIECLRTSLREDIHLQQSKVRRIFEAGRNPKLQMAGGF